MFRVGLISRIKKLDSDPMKTTEGKIQRMLTKIKPKLSEHEQKVLYPSGSSPGKFYGTAKIHKVSGNGNIDQLPIRSIVSNLNAATYQLAKHFSKILSPLRESEYTIKSTRHFMEIIKHKKVLEGFQTVSFDVKSLFTNVPLETTIDIILRRISTNHELTTSLTKKEVKELLLLCTKNVHFTFNVQIYVQVDGVTMGSPLAPLLADIFIIELERSLIPNLRKIKFWRRYVDDTICFVKIGSIEYIRSVLNSFHKNIQFTYEVESNAKLPFLNICLCEIITILQQQYIKKRVIQMYIYAGTLSRQYHGREGH